LIKTEDTNVAIGRAVACLAMSGKAVSRENLIGLLMQYQIFAAEEERPSYSSALEIVRNCKNVFIDGPLA